MPFFWKKVDCTESVEEALNRLDRESKEKKLKEKLAKEAAEKEKVAQKLKEKLKELQKAKENRTSDDAMSTEIEYPDNDLSRILYPERGGVPYKSRWRDILFRGEGREAIDKLKCEDKVWKVINQSHLVRLLLDALKASGCEVDIRRHISCEVCDRSVTGGYDPYMNQIVICQNTARYKHIIQGSLTHELIHMFDYCRHNVDFSNVKHLACSEIRAANLAHCGYFSGFLEGSVTLGNVKDQHQICVRERAIRSVLAVRNMTKEEAGSVVDSVFDKCYNDMEPIGRRVRRGSDHHRNAYWERVNMGYI